MSELAGKTLTGRFEIRRELGRGGMGVVYEAYDRELGVPTALKTLRELKPENLYLFKREFRALADIEHPNLVELGELHFGEGSWFVTMELLSGSDFLTYVSVAPVNAPLPETLEDCSMTRPATPEALQELLESETQLIERASDHTAQTTESAAAFDEARLRSGLQQLALGLRALHASGHAHLDIKPSNVLVERGRVVIVDFGLVRPFEPGIDPNQDWDHTGSERVAGTLKFMAPEQLIDGTFGPAADWYAVGVMLFQALTGRLPFSGRSPQQMLAKLKADAIDPNEVVPGLPEDLAALCRDLLNPDPDHRPQGAEVLERLGVDASLGTHTTPPPRTRVFEGRGEELETMGSALATTRRGQPRAVLVEGVPGVGKTALVDRFLGQQDAEGGVTIFRARCYQKESVPFKAFDPIVDQLTRYLAHHDTFEAISGEAHLAASLFPVLRRVSWVAEATPAGGRLPDNLAQLRLAAFKALKRVFSHIASQTPLVLFIDDLQWADAESLELLEVFLSPPNAPACLLLATTRSFAPGTPGDLPPALVARFERLALSGLSNRDARAVIEQLWADTPGELSVEHLAQESGGHPLFLRELAHLGTNAGPGRAELKLEDAITRRTGSLPPHERAMLEVVSVAGAPIPFEVLCDASGGTAAECARGMQSLAAGDLISDVQDDGVRMAAPYHDRIREAVCAELAERSPARALQLELDLGRSLAGVGGDDPATLFRAVNHLNAARALIEEEEERGNLRSLNLQAGRAALAVTSYRAAKGYFEAAEALLPPDAWRTHYEERVELVRDRIACSYQLSDIAQASALRRVLVERSRTPIDRARAHALWASLEAGRRHCHKAIEAGREGLAELGITLPSKVTVAHAMAEHLRIRWQMRGRSVAEFEDLDRLDDPARLAEVEVISTMTGPAFFVDSTLLAYLLMRLSVISLRDGLSAVSAYGFAGYGLVLSGVFDRHAEAREFGQLARRVNDLFEGHDFDAKIGLLNGTFVDSWVVPLSEARAQLRDVCRDGLQYRDPEYVAYAIVSAALFLTLEGGPIVEAERRTRELLRIADTIGDLDASLTIELILRHHALLRRGSLEGIQPPLPHGEIPDDAFRQLLSDEATPAALFWWFVFRAWRLLLLGDQEGAERMLSESAPHKARVFAFPMAVDYALLELLVEAGRDTQGFAARARQRASCHWRLRKLRDWAEWNKDNFGAHGMLAEAACLELAGRGVRAAGCWDEAIAQARRTGSVRAEMLALAFRGRAGAAADVAERWGAPALAEALAARSSPTLRPEPEDGA